MWLFLFQDIPFNPDSFLLNIKNALSLTPTSCIQKRPRASNLFLPVYVVT